MQKKLIEFYEEEMAPEICDPVFQNSGYFRVSESRSSAIESRLKKKEQKTSKNEQKSAEIPAIQSDVVVIDLQDQNGNVVISHEELLDI